MAEITDKASLYAAVNSYLHRTVQADDFSAMLSLAESAIRNDVRAAELASNYSFTPADLNPGSSTTYLLPPDYQEMIWVTDGHGELPALGAADYLDGVNGYQRGYYLTGPGDDPSRMRIGIVPPVPDDYRFAASYFAKPAALVEDADTNPLLSAHPDLYLYAVLRESGAFYRDAAMYDVADSRYGLLVERINAADQRRRYGPGVAIGNNQNYGAWSGTNGGM